VTSWLNALSLVIGALFVATSAYLASVFLIGDARRASAPDLERTFRARSLGAAAAAGALAAAGLVALHADARALYDGLTGAALPLVFASAIFGIATLVLVARGARRGARATAVGAVVAVVWGWGVAQHPYLLPGDLTIDAGAAPSATLTALLTVAGIAVLLVAPALTLLYALTQRGLIEETARPSTGPAPDR
jgi:cytochrome d ubiquinol oxidase subunit II